MRRGGVGPAQRQARCKRVPGRSEAPAGAALRQPHRDASVVRGVRPDVPRPQRVVHGVGQEVAAVGRQREPLRRARRPRSGASQTRPCRAAYRRRTARGLLSGRAAHTALARPPLPAGAPAGAARTVMVSVCPASEYATSFFRRSQQRISLSMDPVNTRSDPSENTTAVTCGGESRDVAGGQSRAERRRRRWHAAAGKGGRGRRRRSRRRTANFSAMVCWLPFALRSQRRTVESSEADTRSGGPLRT